MIFIDRFLIVEPIGFILAAFQISKQTFDIFVQMALVFFQPQHIICLSLNDLLGNLRLTAHRVNGHNASRNFQSRQELRDGRDLV